MRQLPKKKVTKIDPRKELSPYLNHQINQNKTRKKEAKKKVSASLSMLHLERRKSLLKGAGSIIGVSLLAIIGLGYYISPLANVSSVQVKGATDIPAEIVVKNSGIKASDRVLDYKFHQKTISNELAKKYPEVKNVSVDISHLNRVVLNVHEHSTIAYVREGKVYRKILSDGNIGRRKLRWSEIDQSKPLFIGYNQETSFKDDLKLFDSLPADFRDQVKVLSGSTKRKSQIILVMKDGNLVVGNLSTFKEKIKYYNEIRTKAGKNSLIDLEVGAFSRPLTASEKKAYGIS